MPKIDVEFIELTDGIAIEALKQAAALHKVTPSEYMERILHDLIELKLLDRGFESGLKTVEGWGENEA